MERQPTHFVCTKCFVFNIICMRMDRDCILHQVFIHKTGLRKKRSDCKDDSKCDKCDYKTRNLTTMKKHNLNKHSSLEEREKGFKFYCKSCDFGSFSQDTMDVHYNSEKHKIYMIRQIKK